MFLNPADHACVEIVLMGTGTSHGIPMLGCDCHVCRSLDTHNHRARTCVLINAPQGNLIIDTPPDLRQLLLKYQVSRVHAVLYSHAHADHIYGLDDLRPFGHWMKSDIPLYCEPSVSEVLTQAFAYAFQPQNPAAHHGATPRLKLETLSPGPVDILGMPITCLRLLHGNLPTLGFRIGNFAFCTDVSHIPDETLTQLTGLDDLVIDALRYEPHPTHFSVDQALEIIDQLKPKRAWLTHISHHLDYHQTNSQLPPHVRLAHDGLTLQACWL